MKKVLQILTTALCVSSTLCAPTLFAAEPVNNQQNQAFAKGHYGHFIKDIAEKTTAILGTGVKKIYQDSEEDHQLQNMFRQMTFATMFKAKVTADTKNYTNTLTGYFVGDAEGAKGRNVSTDQSVQHILKVCENIARYALNYVPSYIPEESGLSKAHNIIDRFFGAPERVTKQENQNIDKVKNYFDMHEIPHGFRVTIGEANNYFYRHEVPHEFRINETKFSYLQRIMLVRITQTYYAELLKKALPDKIDTLDKTVTRWENNFIHTNLEPKSGGGWGYSQPVIEKPLDKNSFLKIPTDYWHDTDKATNIIRTYIQKANGGKNRPELILPKTPTLNEVTAGLQNTLTALKADAVTVKGILNRKIPVGISDKGSKTYIKQEDAQQKLEYAKKSYFFTKENINKITASHPALSNFFNNFMFAKDIPYAEVFLALYTDSKPTGPLKAKLTSKYGLINNASHYVNAIKGDQEWWKDLINKLIDLEDWQAPLDQWLNRNSSGSNLYRPFFAHFLNNSLPEDDIVALFAADLQDITKHLNTYLPAIGWKLYLNDLSSSLEEENSK